MSNLERLLESEAQKKAQLDKVQLRIRRLKTEEDAEETDTPGFLLLSEQAEWAIKVND
jgi:hypothetical protein